MSKKPSLAKNMAHVVTSATMHMSQRASELETAGIDIINLSAGEPDFDTPDAIKQAAIEAINQGYTKYTTVDGMHALKQAVRDKFRRDNQLDYQIQQITIGIGAKQIIYNSLLATLNSNNEVIIPTPCWVSYAQMVRLCGGKPVLVSCSADNGYKLTPAQLRTAISSKTRWLILNSPNNPSGACYSRNELEALAEVIRSHPAMLCLCDDIYEHLMYDGHVFATLASTNLFSRTLTINGVSKAYAMTGWRIGYAGGPQWLISAIAKIMSQSTSNPTSISQWAALAALTGDQTFLSQRRHIFCQRRDDVITALNSCNGLTCTPPQGGFYVFANCDSLIGKISPAGRHIKTDMDLAECLLEEAHVAIVPGSAFYCSPYFRLSFAATSSRLAEGCVRIRDFCASLK